MGESATEPNKRRANPLDYASPHQQRGKDATAYLAQYFWFIFKNVIGWILILGSPIVGVLVPGPGGIPLFLVGFALVTFPGKRRLTSRVMRGRRIPIEAGIFSFLSAFVAVLLTSFIIWFAHDKYEYLSKYFEDYYLSMPTWLILVGTTAFVVTWLTFRLGLRVVNFIIQKMPWIRRKLRPVLRKMGLNLLPSRRKRTAEAGGVTTRVNEDEIIEFSAATQNRLMRAWDFLKPWLKRMLAVGITIALFVYIIGPIKKDWANVRLQLSKLHPAVFLGASLMFAAFLVFRALSWRRILVGFGHSIPRPAAMRIWATSELARYLPGAIWQVIGRVHLIKPYGVRGSICSTSQILELSAFLLANVMLAGACLLQYAAKMNPTARPWLYTAMALVPILGFMLHPRVFYGITNWVLVRVRKDAITDRLSGWALLRLLLRTIVALMWQSIAVFILIQPVLGLKWDWWWTVAGAYSLAWCAGFLAIWAPGGLGVREIVFIAAMEVVLPQEVKQKFADPTLRQNLLAMLALILRVWTITGELILTVLAYVLDFKGAIGRVDAPGRTVVK